MLQYIGAKSTMKVETKDSAHSVLFSGLPFYRLSVIFQGSDSLKVVKAQKACYTSKVPILEYVVCLDSFTLFNFIDITSSATIMLR